MKDSLMTPGKMSNEYFEALVHLALEDENSDVSKNKAISETEIEVDVLAE